MVNAVLLALKESTEEGEGVNESDDVGTVVVSVESSAVGVN